MPTATTTFVPGSYSDGDFTASTVTFESAAMPQGATFETAAVEPNDAVFESAAVEPSSFKASSSGGGDASGVSEAGARPSTVKAASGAASSFDEAEAGEYEDDMATGTAAVAPGGAAAGPSRSLKFSIPKFASSDAAQALWRRSRAAASAAAAAATAAVRPRAPPPPPPQPQRLLPLVPLDDEVSAELERAGVTKWAIDQMRARGGVEPALYRAMATGQGQQQQAAPTSWARAQAPRTFGGPSAPSMGISAPAFEGAAAAEAGCAAGSSCRRSRGSFGGVGEAVRSQAADDWRLGAEQPHSPFGDEELAGEGATVADLLQPPPPPPRQQQGYELQQQRQQQQQQGYEQPQGYEQQPDYGEALQHPVHSTWAAPQPVQEAFDEPGEPSSRRRARRRRVLLAGAVPTAASTGASGGNMLEIGACGAYDGNRAQGAGSYGPVVAGVPAGVRLQYPSMEAAPGEPMRVRALIIDAFGHVVASGPSSFMRAASGSGSGGAAANATRAAANTTGKAAPAVKAAPAGKAAAGANASAAAPRPAAGVRLAGTTTAIVLGGVATFRGLEVVGPVNGTVTVWLSAVGAQGRASAAPLAVRLRACEAGAVLTRADGCRTCGPGSFSFDPKASECGTCPPGAWCNGTVVAPLPGAWHSSPRSTQVHACLNPAACARTAAQQQAIIDEQREGFSTVLSVAADPGAVREYEQMLCAPGYAGRLCGQCGEIGGERLGKVGAARCERCAGHGATIGLWVLARLFDLVMLGALIWLSLRAARAALQRFNAALSLTPLGTSRWVPLDCALADRAWLPRSMAALLAVALPALVYVGLAFAAWAASMRVEVPRVGAKPLIVLMATAGLYYPLLTWSALSTLQCVPLDGPAPPGQAALARGAYWALDTGVRCWHGPHLGLALGFGLPVLVAVGAGWLALLAALLRHCRDRLRRRADTAAPAQPRRRRRRGLVHCQQALGVGAGYLRPRRYQWAVVAEGRRFALLALLAAMAPATALAQAYALWGVLAAFLVAEWVARPYSTWALLALQFVVLGAVQGTVYLGSAFAQQGGAFALAGAADAVTALVIILNVGAIVAFLLSLLPGLRRGALLQLLDGDGDGKVTARDLAAFAADLLRGKGGGSGGGGGGDAGGAAGGLRASVVRALEKAAARPAGTVVARPDLDQGEGDQDAARPGSRVAGSCTRPMACRSNPSCL
ncbi:hypothetical protein MNEG_14000 [Monoraphidium neglectum]|uniref:EF-hand domain-containing protein n=1 Tax=Monoraphidium neglectum TaxID=145388 RepID=A0A0D2J1S3_9CHLO|nr:hypothetical protein MNEG_14000 [Monoraphidium neglectum]KIY93962.1 hypothetical protein MNEG_14000 [Monoraphidium neglectum]|eukprot:XP_013892982.1 hypothetical protein MNEG_14000 [Monoraphidium neglectum]